MKKEKGILMAGVLGLIIGLGYFGFRKYLHNNDAEYDDYYTDFHRHFHNRQLDDDHGVEYLSQN